MKKKTVLLCICFVLMFFLGFYSWEITMFFKNFPIAGGIIFAVLMTNYARREYF